ncbi:MAG: hypothetical protein R2825_22565 [Saprospiraceae bacterium]
MTNNTDFTIITDLLTTARLPTGVATFSIRYLPNTSGTRTSTVTIRSDDADEDPYTFIIRRFGISEPTTQMRAQTKMWLERQS